MGLNVTEASFAYAVNDERQRYALSNVSLTVEPGQLVLVVGATGSGKSTLMRLAAGLLVPVEGSVAIDGVPLRAATAGGRIGLVFQDAESQLFAETLIEDVAFGPRNLGEAAELALDHAREALRRVGLPPEEFAARSPFSLSGGEARRAAIAGVLAMGPRYLLADEPTAGLDAAGRGAIRSLIADLRADTGIVVVTHSAEEFLDDADDVIILADGRCTWTGGARDLIGDPSPLFAAGLRPPDVLDLQWRGRKRGRYDAAFTLDVDEVVARLLATRGEA